MMRAVRYDDLVGLNAIRDEGFSGWGPPVVIDAVIVDDFLRIAGAGPLDGQVPGFLLVSIMPKLSPPNDWRIEGNRSAVNLGSPSIRWPDPVAIGVTIRGRSRLVDAREHKRGTIVTLGFEARADNAAQPCLQCTIEVLYQGDGS